MVLYSQVIVLDCQSWKPFDIRGVGMAVQQVDSPTMFFSRQSDSIVQMQLVDFVEV